MLLRQLTGVDADEERGEGGGTYANLFDAHPPFQIDGNFAATAGVAEMLLQSQSGEIVLLPALPAAWPSGRVAACGRAAPSRSTCVKGGRLESATIRSVGGTRCRVRSGNGAVDLSMAPGESRVVDPSSLF